MKPTFLPKEPELRWLTLRSLLNVVLTICVLLALLGCATHGDSVSPDLPTGSVPAWPKDLPRCLTTEQQLSAQFLQSDVKPTCNTTAPLKN